MQELCSLTDSCLKGTHEYTDTRQAKDKENINLLFYIANILKLAIKKNTRGDKTGQSALSYPYMLKTDQDKLPYQLLVD